MPDVSDTSGALSIPPEDAPSNEMNERPSLGTAVGKAARMLHPKDGSLPSGDRAALRRIALDAPVTPALWKVLYDLNIAEPDYQHVSEAAQTAYERNWGLLLMGLSYCAGLHDYDVPLGEALARAGWSETRFVRLLEADADTLPTLIRRMAQYLASKQQRANWTDVAYLLFTRDEDKAEATRLRIARSYYRTRYAQENE